MSSDVALAVSDLTGPAAQPAIYDVRLAVPRGRTRVVLGPIHSGKSMLMRHLVGLECALHGTVTVDGHDFDATGEPEPVLRRMRTRIGVVFEGSALVSRISVLDNVELPLLEHTDASAEQAREAARELLSDVGLEFDDDAMPAQLGRAQQRRVALARALALRPPVLLLDEPTAGLDSHAAAELDEAVARLQARDGFGALVLSHEVRHAYGRAEYVYVMSGGSIVAEGDRETLRAGDHPIARLLLDRRGAA